MVDMYVETRAGGHLPEPDVVVIGGGISGGAVAAQLARQGVSVVLLERTREYRDKVLGEYLVPWGVEEAQRSGMYPALHAAGGNVIRRLVHYDESWEPERAEDDAWVLDTLLPGVPGSMGVGHPAMCDTFTAAASAAGARVMRGVGNVDLTVDVAGGTGPSVQGRVDGRDFHFRPKVVIGADGRESMVRRVAHMELVETPVLGYGVGMLVSGAEAWPADIEVIGNEADRLLFVFPQGNGVVRLYRLVLPHERERFRGVGRAQRLLEEFRVESVPGSKILADADPAGPCLTWPMNDAWVRQPVMPGVVLIGDAAGYTNPLIGQGLSCALRDARMVADAVVADDPAALDFYVEHRRERGRRLRFAVEMFARHRCIMGPGSAERRLATEERMMAEPLLGMWFKGLLAGPERMPAEAFHHDVREALWGISAE